jgi:hypothetical protein
MLNGLFSLFRQKAEEPPANQFILTGSDYALYSKAKAIIEQSIAEPYDAKETISEALRFYEGFILLTKEKHGRYEKYIDLKHTARTPVIDFPSAGNGQLTISISFTGKYLAQVEKIRELTNQATVTDVVKQAMIFYSTAIVDSYYGWQFSFSSPGGPDGGEPIFEDGNQSPNDKSIINIADYFPKGNNQRRVAHGSGGTITLEI